MPPALAIAAWLAVAQVSCVAPAVAAEELIVAVDIGRDIELEEMIILQEDEQIYMPLAELAATILLPLESEGEGVVSGTVTTTETEFSINYPAKQIVIDGRAEPLGSDQVLLFEGELYLAPPVLEKILPVSIEFDFSSLLVRIKADGPLPIQVRRKQEQLRERVLEAKAQAIEPRVVDIPYALFSPPTGDVNLHADWSKTLGPGLAYEALLGAEIGYLTSQLYLRGTEEHPLGGARVRFGRESPSGGVFDVPAITEAWAGDVRQPVQALVGGGGLGRGVLVSTFPLDRPDTYQETTIDGDALPGWEVELYHNGLLAHFQAVGQDGRYVFEDVPLFYGVNIFRLVFYGPQGQLREETREVTIGGHLIPPGETLWSVFVGQPRHLVLDPLLDSPPAKQELGLTLEAARGFSDSVSGSAFVTRTPTSALADSDYALSAGLGAQISWNDILFTPNAAVQDAGGYALDLGVITTYEGISLSARYAIFEDFHSIEAGDAGNRLDATGIVRARKSVDLPGLGSTLVGVRGEHESFVDGRDQFGAGLDVRHGLGMLFVDHMLDYRLTTFPVGASSTNLLYEPTASYFAGKLWAHGAARFRLLPEMSLDHLAASMRYRLDERSSAGAGISHTLDPSKTSVNVSYSRELDFGFVSATGSYSDDGELALGVGLSFSFGASRNGSFFVTSQRLADAGAVAPFVYHDTDGDRQFDASVDRPLPDVGVRLDDGRRPASLTDTDGTMLLGNLSPERPMTIAIDEATLDDPFWTSATGPLLVQPRRGRILDLELPVVEGGEIAGTLSASRGDDLIPVGGVLVSLIDSSGRQVAETRSLHDGFYMFERLPPDTYTVQVGAGQELDQIEIEPATVEVELPPGGEVLDGIDMTLELKGTLAPPPEPLADEDDVFGAFPADPASSVIPVAPADAAAPEDPAAPADDAAPADAVPIDPANPDTVP